MTIDTEPTLRDDPFTRLHRALQDPQLRKYIEQSQTPGDQAASNPLTARELPQELVTSEAFNVFVADYGWPDETNAGDIAPVRQYADGAHFWRNMYGSDGLESYLNNFKEWLCYKPLKSGEDAETIPIAEYSYASQPAVHRAYAIAEPLFASLRDIIQSTINSSPDIIARGQQYIQLAEEHPDVPEAAYMAYRLLGRLLTKDDLRIQRKILSGQLGLAQEDITDAHTILTQ